MQKGFKAKILALVGVLFIIIAIWFLGNSFLDGVRDAGGIRNLLHFDVPLFILASMVMAAHLTLAGYTWTMVTNTSGGHLGFKKGFSIHFLSQVGKYVPGKVWAAMGKYTLSRNSGLSTAQTGHGLVLETVFIVLGCLITMLPLIPMAAKDTGMGVGFGMALAIGLTIILFASIHPFVFKKLAAFVARIMKTDDSIYDYSFTEMLRLLPAYVLVFLLLGVAYWSMSLAFGLNMPFLPGIFIYPAAMGIGYLAIFAPGGLGARELTTVWLVHLVVPDCDPGLAEMTALVARLWITAGEAIAFGFSFPLYGVSFSSLKKIMSDNQSLDRDTIQRDKG